MERLLLRFISHGCKVLGKEGALGDWSLTIPRVSHIPLGPLPSRALTLEPLFPVLSLRDLSLPEAQVAEQRPREKIWDSQGLVARPPQLCDCSPIPQTP